MHTGMLWFDNSDTPFSLKIEKAVEYYKKKNGKVPNLCLIHPSMVKTDMANEFNIGSLKVKKYRPVLPGHIWIGIESKD